MEGSKRMLALYGPTHSQVDTDGNKRQIEMPLGLIYNETFCYLIHPNGYWLGFAIAGYSKITPYPGAPEIECFRNAETETTCDGFYHIEIKRHGKAVDFEIICPTGSMRPTMVHEYHIPGI